MYRIRPMGVLVVVGITAHMLIACQTVGPREQLQWNATTIADFRSVAGQWEGLMIRSPRSPKDDWLSLKIGDDGSYEFASYRGIGVFSGRGQLTLENGKLTTQSERGRATLSLYTANGERMLRAEGVTTDDLKY